MHWRIAQKERDTMTRQLQVAAEPFNMNFGTAPELEAESGYSRRSGGGRRPSASSMGGASRRSQSARSGSTALQRRQRASGGASMWPGASGRQSGPPVTTYAYPGSPSTYQD